MKLFFFWKRRLPGVGILIAGFGILTALATGTPLLDIFNRRIDPAFWTGAIDGSARQFQHWLYGVRGATIAR